MFLQWLIMAMVCAYSGQLTKGDTNWAEHLQVPFEPYSACMIHSHTDWIIFYLYIVHMIACEHVNAKSFLFPLPFTLSTSCFTLSPLPFQMVQERRYCGELTSLFPTTRLSMASHCSPWDWMRKMRVSDCPPSTSVLHCLSTSILVTE